MISTNVINKWLRKFNICPKEQTKCDSKGVYFMGTVDINGQCYSGHTFDSYRERNNSRFKDFEGGPENWGFIDLSTTGSNIKDLLLEDTLIITLTRSTKIIC